MYFSKQTYSATTSKFRHRPIQLLLTADHPSSLLLIIAPILSITPHYHSSPSRCSYIIPSPSDPPAVVATSLLQGEEDMLDKIKKAWEDKANEETNDINKIKMFDDDTGMQDDGDYNDFDFQAKVLEIDMATAMWNHTIITLNHSIEDTFTPTKKPHIHDISHFEVNLSPTPEKSEETLNIRCKKEPAKLPKKHRLLSEDFHCMTTSLRLLNLLKQKPTFQNIRRIVETLTGRELSYKSLAQIKFILPEAVQTDKILFHNKTTLCMEPDIKVTLLFDVIEGHVEHSDYMALSSVFTCRLLKFANAHSEDYVVPEAELPQPFNRKEITTVSAKSLPINSSIQIPPNLAETEPLQPSHLPPSFRRCFSTKEFGNRMKTELSQSPILPSSVEEMDFNTCLDPVKQEKPLLVASENTPLKYPLVINEINIDTPDLSTPKRSVDTEDKKIKSMVNQKVTASGLFAKRSLDFTVFDEESAFLDGNSTSDGGSSAKWVERGNLKTELKPVKLTVFLVAFSSINKELGLKWITGTLM
ncbi:hypothetical protein E3N88_43285 [Mikania micrantha]|uniref:CDT1 Geminin-binding domain-containing protein n=1 Tax=Mikania micrantha TaxID=192012 RepID=A0A5N6LFA7_9ASTR|nr:hypothetical protein E3N88_43285 [Mikania micrantha]